MDINKILSDLGIDLSNPEARLGAIEAIEAILDSRNSASMGGASGMGGSSGEQEVEVDPDLIQPSIKHSPVGNDEDVEIDDEEDILSQIKHNESDDESEDEDSNEPTSSESGGSNSDNDTDTSESDSNKSSSDPDSDDFDEEEIEDYDDVSEPEDSENKSKTAKTDSTKNDEESDDDWEDNEDSEDNDEEEDLEDEEDSDDDSDSSEEPGDADGDNVNSADSEEDSDDEEEVEDEEDSDDDEADDWDFDEDDLVDDNLKDLKDDEIKAKEDARKIKRERTLAAAEKALEKAKANKVSASLIRELESAVAALEALTEAVAKNIRDVSDDDFNRLVNRVLDAIDAIGNSGLTYSSDEERAIRAKEIKADLASATTQNELSAEDASKIRAETQAIKAREKEADKYRTKAKGTFKGFQDFLNSLYRAVALQVSNEETADSSWSALSRRNSGVGVIQQGKRIQELPNKKIPVIDFYFDQSGSWDESDIRIGEKAVQCLADMEEKGDIKTNIYYFANHVHTDAQSARNEGGTWAWNEIVKNIIATQATNVIIMTDSDMEDRWNSDRSWDQGKAASYTVPGYVWYLWRNGSNAPRLPRDLKGRGGTQQFSFTAADM